jgi:TatD DNase family protein
MFIDTHCHLDMLKDISGVVVRAQRVKVNIILSAGVDAKTNRKVLELSRDFSAVEACLGIYPIDSLKMSETEIEKEIKFILKNDDKIVCIGEVGMDYKEDLVKHKKQKRVFEMFIDLAKEIEKPLLVHSRKAEKDCINILEKREAKKVIMHCFFGRMRLVDRIVKNGWFLSIPTCVYHNEQIQEVVRRVPIENLLCETDSPFLHPFREKTNEPKNVIESYKKIAQIKGVGLGEIEKKIEENFKKQFNS